MKPEKIPDKNSYRIKDPDDWVTGDEEMTGAQASYLQTAAKEAHEPIARNPHQGRGFQKNRSAPSEDQPGPQVRAGTKRLRSARITPS
jgi:hypothetical protein